MVSINTNIGAYSAQQNLEKANAATVASTTRLSSGNRIDRAATDIAGLSIGTILATKKNTDKTALANAGQGSSLLQVADGGLKNISDILQRLKALATQAISGALSSVERGFLNQEFVSLTDEIDRTVNSTKFSSVTLLDGSLSKSTEVVDNRFWIPAGIASVTDTFLTVTGAGTAGDRFSVNGVTVELVASTTVPGSDAAKDKVIMGAAQAQTSANIAAFLNASNDARLRGATFVVNGNNIDVQLATGRVTGAVQYITYAETTDTGNFFAGVNSTAVAGESEDGLGVSRTFATGTITGDLLVNGGTTAALSGGGILLAGTNTQSVEGNENFLGKFGGDNVGKINVTYAGALDSVVFSVKVGNDTYTSTSTNIANAAVVPVTLINDRNGSGQASDEFRIMIRGGAFTLGDIESQEDADIVGNRLNDALSDITFVQSRDVKSFAPGATVVVDGVQKVSMSNMSVNFVSDDFDNVNIEGVKITAAGQGETDAKIEVTINGEIYRSYAGIGSQLATNRIIYLQNLSDSNKSLQIVTGSTSVAGLTAVAANIDSQASADAFAAALEKAFGTEKGNSKLNFQVGSESTDSIGVQLRSASSNTLFKGAALDVKTTASANEAGIVLDKAIEYVASLRADVGALQSRFSYVADNLNTSIENTDAARGALMDTDISAESTLFAQSQVKMQASIAVLAQANQLPQNLLKLLG
jgi:flagellin